jgi:multidrug efflux pump subunit AcrB
VTARASVVLSAVASATLVAAYCAWFLRPPNDFELLERFPFALADALAEGDYGAVEERLAPTFTWRDGSRRLERAEAVAALRLFGQKKAFAPAVARVVAVRADETKSRLVVYGVVVEGDPSAERAPPVRAHRIEMLVEESDDGFVVLDASR